jgi:plastocyanin
MRMSLALMAVVFVAASLLSAAGAEKGREDRKADHVVKMKDNEFDKKDIKVKVGESVVWHNSGDNTHTATSDEGTDKDLAFDTKDVAAGKDSKVVTFKKAGKVSYHCEHHKKTMTGTITIE